MPFTPLSLAKASRILSIRPTGTFPRKRGKGRPKDHNIRHGTKIAARIARSRLHLTA